MRGFKKMFQSERTVWSILSLAAMTFLTAIKIVPQEEFISYLKLLTGILITSKTVEKFVRQRPEIPPAEVNKS